MDYQQGLNAYQVSPQKYLTPEGSLIFKQKGDWYLLRPILSEINPDLLEKIQKQIPRLQSELKILQNQIALTPEPSRELKQSYNRKGEELEKLKELQKSIAEVSLAQNLNQVPTLQSRLKWLQGEGVLADSVPVKDLADIQTRKKELLEKRKKGTELLKSGVLVTTAQDLDNAEAANEFRCLHDEYRDLLAQESQLIMQNASQAISKVPFRPGEIRKISERQAQDILERNVLELPFSKQPMEPTEPAEPDEPAKPAEPTESIETVSDEPEKPPKDAPKKMMPKKKVSEPSEVSETAGPVAPIPPKKELPETITPTVTETPPLKTDVPSVPNLLQSLQSKYGKDILKNCDKTPGKGGFTIQEVKEIAGELGIDLKDGKKAKKKSQLCQEIQAQLQQ